MVIEEGSGTSAPIASTGSGRVDIDRNHPLFLHPNDTPGGSNLRGNYGKGVVIGGSTSHGGGGTSHGESGTSYSGGGTSHGGTSTRYAGGGMNSGNTSSGGNYFNRQPSNNSVKPPRKHTLVYEFCSYNGHTKKNYYKLIGYPPDWPKSKKKGEGQFANQVINYEELDYDMNFSKPSFSQGSSSHASTSQQQQSLPPHFTQ
ncbi:hypothetical protein KY290_028710 [Solanum tuberosum]|uniref:Uncharacterized protein n=1 Tax=Solanum tuberosum TaxID=4113 RepID=A0ABQ7UIP7_SOLTU|nr:hypothetical protein KY290_028710 [Solanum tuberosum]